MGGTERSGRRNGNWCCGRRSNGRREWSGRRSDDGRRWRSHRCAWSHERCNRWCSGNRRLGNRDGNASRCRAQRARPEVEGFPAEQAGRAAARRPEAGPVVRAAPRSERERRGHWPRSPKRRPPKGSPPARTHSRHLAPTPPRATAPPRQPLQRRPKWSTSSHATPPRAGHGAKVTRFRVSGRPARDRRRRE